MGITTHNLGFPRIGANRELKFAQEAYWRGNLDAAALQGVGQELRIKHWQQQSKLSSVPVGDFSFYDQVLDMSFTLGHLPERFHTQNISSLDNYFRVARGRSTTQSESKAAGEMTKWFDTNYHYIVPEFTKNTKFELDASRLLTQVSEAQNAGHVAKPVIIGPVSYLWLGKSKDDSQRLDHLDDLLETYAELLQQLADAGVSWVQVDEPVLVMQLDAQWQQALKQAYHQLRHPQLKLLLCSYFGRLAENLQLACELPVDGLHIDAINARDEITQIVDWLPVHKVLSLGVINGRNIWKTDLDATLELLEPIYQRLGDRLWLAPSCSLLHVPVDLDSEAQLDAIIKPWLAFALQKLDELVLLANILQHGRKDYVSEIAEHQSAVLARYSSDLVSNEKVQTALAAITPDMLQRKQSFEQRATLQQQALDLPAFPTTTIGSFPQTEAIRKTRKAYKRNELSDDQYRLAMQAEIRSCIAFQENIGLDVLVHGEAERNDMVEYFGEQLSGYVFSQFGWVQSYGSRCVKPPIIYGDIERKQPMTVEWAEYAQSCSEKPVKGMLTGPVTMLNWSFVRDDQPRAVTCQQLALAIRYEVLDLERAGIKAIQIDEAALREGLPLRRSDWSEYLDWAVAAFRLSANGVTDKTQIHTHMCYSEFNDIIEAIAAMDADVITIETSRSDMELLSAFENFDYPNQIGPGVYDIHTPNIPNMDSIVALMNKAAEKIPAQRLWVNPDCGLKTRSWSEVRPALENMVKAASVLRRSIAQAA